MRHILACAICFAIAFPAGYLVGRNTAPSASSPASTQPAAKAAQHVKYQITTTGGGYLFARGEPTVERDFVNYIDWDTGQPRQFAVTQIRSIVKGN